MTSKRRLKRYVRSWLRIGRIQECPFYSVTDELYCACGNYRHCLMIFPELQEDQIWKEDRVIDCPCNVLGKEMVIIRAKLFVKGELDNV